ncbi:MULTISPECIES: SH3 domain-containing protein [Bacillus]|uniref:N-acetylmuramoyl-L-alanine amidase n=1 Tax=Bacillus glycinifermentans TaxID=1664069 RepID=A0AAJ3YZI2_9BACI|nr:MULTISPECIES: SH3 domain-containing protein [Bacillus]KKB72615.1 N-acetylmuramoyl-L-alanine amidase [Bacillus sp. TH008]MDU0069925.1 SH3 domain-containing protein [Bacillus sp. IG6]MED8017598.1 SH3 domain-containing protein [Bacillus glycinifermentans]QAT66280.1 N-acetylmuramoyl-L-alanine amidase [Bacillus glycinifermentans]WKB75994.1 SH3 domain-containing protein [Bacillus glycinifermentans]
MRKSAILILSMILIAQAALYTSSNTASAAIGEAVVATDKINVRSGPGLSHDIVSVVKRDETYPILEEKGDWIQIRLSGGQKGWVVSWLIKKKGQASGGSVSSEAKSGQVTSTATDLRIRKGPGTSYEVSGTFPKGEKAALLKTDGSWVKISYQNVTGWVHSDYVSGGTSANESSSSGASQKSGTVGVSSLNVRSSASHQAGIIASLKRNTAVTILNEQHGWYEIEFNGQKGWVASHYILTDDGKNSGSENAGSASSSGSGENATIVYDGTNIRSEPSTSSSVVKRARKGEAYPITGKKSDWYEIALPNGNSAYIANWVVQTSDQSGSSGDSGDTEPPLSKPSGSSDSIKNKTIVIDAGHGGHDSGTIGTRGTLEKRLTIKTAKLLAAKLRADGVNVYMTRNDDSFVSLQSRVATSHYRNADAFISIHFDSFANASVRGNTAYYYSPSKDKGLAADVQSEIEKQSPLPSRGVLFGDYFVLRENNRPAALFELGYLSHPQDEAIVSTNGYRERVTDGIRNGLENYFN